MTAGQLRPETLPEDTRRILEGIEEGRRGALARAITWIENGDPRAAPLLDFLQPRTGQAWRTGITGPPGAGKSTLVDGLTRYWSEQGRKTALLAVDPSSPFSGGALLGDRVRLDRALEQTDVFVRSMANRGSLGGLALATGAAADLLDAFGFEEIVLETVGVGQAEVDIAAAADVTVVVLTPASGDGVQAMKAGLMEVGDVFVVNKADEGGAERLAAELEQMLALRQAQREPDEGPDRQLVPENPRILVASAREGRGIEALAGAIEETRREGMASGRVPALREQRALMRVRRLLAEGLRAAIWENRRLRRGVRQALARGEGPDAFARRLLQAIFNRLDPDEPEEPA